MSLSDDFHDLPSPLSHLQVAGLAFDALTAQPRLMSLDCTEVTARAGLDLDLPDRSVLLCDLRVWLLEHTDNHAAADAVWRELIRRARLDKDWQIAALGMALPRLVRQAGALARDFRGDAADIDAAMVEGFLQALTRRVHPSGRGLHAKLCWAAYRAGHDVRYADADVMYRDDLDNESAAPHRGYGHVDLLLARAVALQLIDPDEADLIADTGLEYYPIEDLAEQAGEPVDTLRRRRERAGLRLAGGLAGGYLSGGPVAEPVRKKLAENAAKRRANRQQPCEANAAA
jgi:DNA-directed RNA polymerase specialized sigma24 family protein